MKISFNWFRKDKSKPFIFLEECLSESEANKVKVLNFEQLISAEREERLRILSEVIDKDKAVWLNSRIEKDFILKKQKEGLMTWVNGQKDIRDKYRKEIIRKISELENPLSEKEMDVFIEDLAGLAIGAGVTLEEAQVITDLCKKCDEAKLAMENGGSKAEYEIARKNLDDYMEIAKNS